VKQTEYKQRVLIIAYRRLPESYKLSMLATYDTLYIFKLHVRKTENAHLQYADVYVSMEMRLIVRTVFCVTAGTISEVR